MNQFLSILKGSQQIWSPILCQGNRQLSRKDLNFKVTSKKEIENLNSLISLEKFNFNLKFPHQPTNQQNLQVQRALCHLTVEEEILSILHKNFQKTGNDGRFPACSTRPAFLWYPNQMKTSPECGGSLSPQVNVPGVRVGGPSERWSGPICPLYRLSGTTCSSKARGETCGE